MNDYDMGGRLVAPGELPQDSVEENSLRPKTLEDYVGQERVKENLRVYLEAAKLRGEPMDHVLLYGRRLDIGRFRTWTDVNVNFIFCFSVVRSRVQVHKCVYMPG